VIKINLLESVTDRPAGVAFVEDKVSSTRTQTFLLALTVVALLVLGVGYDYVSANAQHETATKELEKQRRINEQMNAVKREQADLEKKMADINFRIDAIEKLRGSQQGPGALLAEIKARFDGVPGLYLKSVEQKDAELVIKGESPNEAAVTRFGQSMEFSSGMFTNLNIETQRETPQSYKPPPDVAKSGSKEDPANPNFAGYPRPINAPEVVTFTIKCNYARTGAQQQSANPANPVTAVPASHVARN
jgi:Tfp pilus assembly protein PilN